MYWDINENSLISGCDLPVCERGIKITNKDLKYGTVYVSDKTDDWSSYDYLQVSAFSENASETVLCFMVRTEKKDDGTYGGYCYYSTVSWVGEKILTFPLKYGIVTRNNPTSGLENVLGLEIIPFWGGVAPGKTTVYIDKIWCSDEPAEEKEYFIECDESTDYYVEGLKNRKYDVITLLKEKCPDRKHPRLVLDDEGFKDLKECVRDIEFAKNSYENVLKKADEAFSRDIPKHILYDGRRLSRESVVDAYNLLLAYKIGEEEKYKNKLRDIIFALCKFPDWNPPHDIDVGDIARPVALAYDWLYDEWTDKEKRIMRNAMLKNGFEAMVTCIREDIGYAADEGNHNTVTITGLCMMALVIGDEPGCEDISNEIINGAIECIPKNLKTFAPYGVCTEGAGYWVYGQGNFYQLQASMYKCLGTDFGLGELPGMDTTGDYLIAMHGVNNKVFNYADAHDKDENALSPSLLWLSELYKKPEYAKAYIDNCEGGFTALLYFKKNMINADDKEKSTRDYFFGNVGAMKKGSDNDMLYLGFKGGKIESHCDLDFGTFVFDGWGERWISDLGCDPYDMPGMWEYHKTAGRWSYYRKRAEGNNCIVINPEYNPENIADQSVEADCNIINSKSAAEGSFALMDLTSAYPDIAEKIYRKFSLNDSGCEITDEIELREEATLYSFFHTKAEVEMIDEKSAKMTINDKTVIFKLETDSDAKLVLMDAEPLLEEFKNTPHNDNSDYRKIAVYAKSFKQGKIKISIERC